MNRAEELYNKLVAEGESAIDGFIAQRQAEELFLDFKRSADGGSGKRLHQNDRNNLAKAISGFGNSEGGVIIWGVECSPGVDYADVARAKHSITDAERFRSWLEGAISGCTIPPHTGVKNHPIRSSGPGKGFVATLIPKSDHAPHQVVGKLQYYIRAGSDFVPAPHGVLAGMFGRRPQPSVAHSFVVSPAEVAPDERVKCQIGFLISNNGPGIATDIFMHVTGVSFLGENCILTFHRPDPENWVGHFLFGVKMSMISNPNVRLPFGMQLQPISLEAFIGPPFTKDLEIIGIYGCGQSPPGRFELQNSPEVVEGLYVKFITKHRDGTLTESDMHDFTIDVFSTRRDEGKHNEQERYDDS
ncbi:MAG: ATP-binding protein [bacterium]|nr:ATP-binding protein [bacterium]